MLSSILTTTAVLVLGMGSEAATNERVLGVFVFHRLGDRTAKIWTPVSLTALGANEVHSSGTFYRSRYISSSSDLHIIDMSSDFAVLSQLSVSSPSNPSETLGNGTKVEAPLGGYQYIPVDEVTSGATGSYAENNAWLQGNTNCNNAVVSSNNYFVSPEYKSTYSDTKDFYESLIPVINGTYAPSAANFKNGYGIFDIINVARIHNSSTSSHVSVTNGTLKRLHDLASTHEWNLAYNATDPVRAVPGAVLAGQILNSLQAIVEAKRGSPRFNIQFGAYGSFMSFFGLAQLPVISADFYGITNYASSMTFELSTTSTVEKPTEDDINVRFFYSNGTAALSSLKPFPLFGQKQIALRWASFKTEMNKFAVADTQHWCRICGNNAGECAANSTEHSGDEVGHSKHDGNEVTKPVAGVIGALVAVAVTLSLEALAMLLSDRRIVKRSSPEMASRRRMESDDIKLSQGQK
ncbi:hypothetical protein ED733_002474 [Metarhizium rileyi]|uniref:Histidine phosphatase superfamily, clade-2 n=1 Tax=Metarhizium rileyi (strain RCEF 4871) TaxID=1649241 RepID=A0A5C6G546_METRR|nr:hypothetical protein ED733_002474 [Metarhizium rileyi]